jgi:hypothetical protein
VGRRREAGFRGMAAFLVAMSFMAGAGSVRRLVWVCETFVPAVRAFARRR